MLSHKRQLRDNPTAPPHRLRRGERTISRLRKGRAMRLTGVVLTFLLACVSGVRGAGLLIPEEKTLPPLAMLDHKVTITIEDQVATTRVEQTFRNHTDRPLEATYLFPVPKGAKEVLVSFIKKQGLLDRDFQLFYQLGDKDVGLTALAHRPIAGEHGYFLMLATPKVELKKDYEVPRDLVLVLDTSGSMRGTKMEQARKALKYCLDNLGKHDRFGLINFATTVNKYKDNLTDASADQVGQAKKWVDELEATGGTAIYDALEAALELRTKDEERTFTVVFFTDGQPTIGEGDKIKPEVILKNTIAKNNANTRIFTFGVGDDVNATLLDQLADRTRALATEVRPQEDIEAK